jgi:regulator of cell morphogenesis and NO signaling
MADALLANGRLLYVFPYFKIELGFGEKTIGQICYERKISTPLFLFICNIYSFESYVPNRDELKLISIDELIEYLQGVHRDYIETRIPNIITGVLNIAREESLIDGNMIAVFCEKYRQKTIAHIQYEDEILLPYFRRRIHGDNSGPNIIECEITHRDIDAALADLKNIIIKFLPYSCNIEQCRPALLDLFDFDYEIRRHCKLEETTLIPLWAHLEKGRHSGFAGVEFSEREKETLIEIVHGLSNKQIAEKLHLSPHTIVTHRRNIIRKTGIITPQGLVFYAIKNNLVSKDEL